MSLQFEEHSIDDALLLLEAFDQSERLALLNRMTKQVFTTIVAYLKQTNILNKYVVMALERAFDLDENRSVDLELALDLARAVDLARALNLDPNFDLERVQRQVRLIYMALGGDEADLLPENTAKPAAVIIRFEGIDKLTPRILANVVAPYLAALGDMQQVLCDLLGTPFTEPEIVAFHANTLEVTGIVQAHHSLCEDILPWCKTYAGTFMEEEAAELEQARLQLAIAILDRHVPDLLRAERMTHALRLLPPLVVLSEMSFNG